MTISSEDERRINEILDARLKSSRHENGDHLDAGLLLQKIASGAVAGFVPVSVSGQAYPSWQAQDGGSSWSTVFQQSGYIAGGTANNQYIIWGNGGGVSSGVNVYGSAAFPFISLTASDYAAPAGRTLQWRLHVTYVSNGVSPGALGSGLLWGIGQLSGLSGAASGNVTVSCTRNASFEAILTTNLNSFATVDSATATALPNGDTLYCVYVIAAIAVPPTAATYSSGFNVELQYRYV